MLPENLNIPPPRPKRKPSHPYPRKAEPQSSEALLPAQSWSGSLPALAAAAAAATPSLQQHGGTAQARGVNPGFPAESEGGANTRTSPFSAVQQQVHSGLHQVLGGHMASGGGADGQQGQTLAEGQHTAAVAAVAAAASAAAAAAAAAVVAAAEAHVQASLQANPPKGFPFFGLPPSILATMGLQLQSEAQVTLPCSVHPAPTALVAVMTGQLLRNPAEFVCCFA